MSDVLAYGPWRNNAELIVACRDLGYLPADQHICDPTYGYGRFWTLWRPELFWASDLNPEKSPIGVPFDARSLPHPSDAMGATVIDAPYKCVSLDTEILTRRGWRKWSDLIIGEEVYTLDHESGMGAWQPLLDIHYFPGSRERVAADIKRKGFSALATDDHRWPVEMPSGNRAWRTTDSLSASAGIVRCAPDSGLPTDKTIPDAMVELVAWFWTEGHVRGVATNQGGVEAGYGHIAQSRVVNPANCARIEASLTALYGPPVDQFRRLGRNSDVVKAWRVRRDGKLNRYIFSASVGRDLLRLAPAKVPSWDFIFSLTSEQLDLFVQVSILADGTETSAGPRLTQKHYNMAERFQVAATMAGHSTSIQNRDDGNGWVVTLRRGRLSPVGRKPINLAPYPEPVWCPTVANGTWFARRDGTCYFTGNCNGQPTRGKDSMDESYGVDEPATVAGRYTLMAEMLAEAMRVTKPGGYVLFKCQAQVVSGKVHWQPRFFANLGEAMGMRLKDELHLITRPRPQPGDRAQKHARRNGSTMLVFKVGKVKRALDDPAVDYYGQKPW